MAILYLEAVASRSPGSAGFAIDQSRASLPYFVDPFSVEDALTDILGTTQYDSPGTGKMKRKLPKAHPFYPWLYAERIASVQGIGRPELFNVTLTYEAAPVVSKMAIYTKYLAMVEFLQRPYLLLSDDSIPVFVDTWVDENNINQTFKHAREYARFCDYDVEADSDTVTAQHGTMLFRGGAAEGKSFTGMPRVTVSKATITFRWFGVPFRYVESDNSYLYRYQNYINQAAFYNWAVGSLLYKGFKIVRKYTPVVPDTTPVFGNVVYGTDKLCDLALVFEWTRRERAATPATPVANNNWLMEGHNLMPNYVDRKFYYVSTSSPDPTKQFPLFLSAPVPAILFSDPDAT